MKNAPTLDFAQDILKKYIQADIIDCERLLTGNQNFVYCVKTLEQDYIVRITDKKHESYFEAGQFWQEVLIPLGVPVEPFLFMHKDDTYCSVIMHKVPGADLQHVYKELTNKQKEHIAEKIFSIQNKVHLLPQGNGYGYGRKFDCDDLFPSWKDFLISHFDNFKERIIKNQKVDISILNPALALLDKINFSNVKPQAYLRDITERNVMIHDGEISGIIDVDDIGFGDPLMVIALTEVALIKEGLDNYYPQYWKSLMNLDEEAETRYQFYLIFYLLTFIKSCGSNTYNNQKMHFDLDFLIKKLQEIYTKF